MACSVLLIRWQHLLRPIHAQSARLIHLFFCLFSQTQQQMRASIPTPKQLQKPRSRLFIWVNTSLLSLICMISPSQQVLMVECQTSNQDSSPYSHSSNLSFSYPTSPRENEMGEPPQPRQREKSLPVPMGMMQNETLVRSIPASPTNETTHRTVPSPPQTTATTFPLPLLSTLACTRRIFSSAASLPCASNRSMKCSVMVVSLPNWQVSFRLGMVRYCVPTPPPDLELMKRKKEMRSWSPCALSIVDNCDDR